MKKRGFRSSLSPNGILRWSTACILAGGVVGLTGCDRGVSHVITEKDVEMATTQSQLENNPLFPASGPATGSLNGLHPKSKFLAIAIELRILFRVNGQATGPKTGDAKAETLRYAPTIAYMDIRVEYTGAMGVYLLNEPTSGVKPYLSSGENLDLEFNQVCSSETIDGDTGIVQIRRGQIRTLPFYASYDTFPYSGTTGGRGKVTVVLDGEFIVYANADKKEVLMGLKRLNVTYGETQIDGGSIMDVGVSWATYLTNLPNAQLKNLSFVWERETHEVKKYPTAVYV